MIKKLLTTGLIFGALWTSHGQELQHSGYMQAKAKGVSNSSAANKSLPGVVLDEVDYFFMKHHYRNNGPVPQGSFPTVKSPFTTATVTLNEFGSAYLNPDNLPITVTTASVLVSRQANATSTTVPLKVYIYSASASGVPIARLDSISTAATNTLGDYCGGTFTAPVTTTTSIFISFKPLPLANTDTVRAFFTAGYAPTSTNAPTPSVKFGDGLGRIRFNGNLVSTTGSFGSGTDYEPVVAAEVSFNYTANATAPAPSANSITPGAYCANASIDFTNTSTSIVKNPQFNWNAFRKKWNPLLAVAPTPPTADSIYNWTFAGITPTATIYNENASHTISSITGTANVNLLVKYKKYDGTASQDLASWNLPMADCGIVSGLNESNSNLTSVVVYPNPVTASKVNISGLQGNNHVIVYNVLGKVIYSTKTTQENVNLDMDNLTSGTYFVRISDETNQYKVVKLIKQ